ncbi:MAG: hypothetical protein BM557_05575 [Flavobacterium sp. MedPE-SWcel]|uniref:SIMPL domain-containing protein n=1 Tax=uncultured Flavobacterium sp. TaxID=165435 RepID=UPI000921C359|nr:SIMPL domain-containing protein [uncultured Flavobacterium sp.]OIQ20140.1 MAG: hypothetical protein BM557_05575 [Flavobacterium sp. MedPE-SWcel]
MKNFILALLVLTGTFAGAQTAVNTSPQINVSGKGIVMAVPDEAIITIGVTKRGADAEKVKNDNDIVVDKVLKYLKKMKLSTKDYQTQRVYLNSSKDYKTRKYTFTASQVITIYLRDLTKYDSLLSGLTSMGVNNIQGVQFKTSKEEEYKSEARIKAVEDANKKANDYARALGVYVGFPILVTDNTSVSYPRSPMYAMEMKSMVGDSKETLAAGEIAITASVNITYALSLIEEK